MGRQSDDPGGFYRIRTTGKPMFLPTGLHATKKGIQITFTEPIDRASASDASHYSVKSWSLRRTANYGSKHYDEMPQAVSSATLSDDARTVFLTLPEIHPTWCMEIQYRLKGRGARPASVRFTTRFTTLLTDARSRRAGPRENGEPDDRNQNLRDLHLETNA